MTEKNKILLAFKHEGDINVFTDYLSGLGFGVIPVKDGARALELALQEVPSLIIVDLDLPIISGERVFQILRNNPNTSKIPFLFISNGIADIKGFRTGVDIFLLRPFNLEEVYSRIRGTLSQKGASVEVSKGIEGKLSHISLADILQFLHLNRKEGELKISSDRSAGTVYIKDGQIYNSVVDGVDKEKALFRLLQWAEGSFEFVPRPIAVTKKIRSTTGNLLMEGMRQMDEFKKRAEHFPDRKSSLKLRLDPAAMPKGLQPIVYEVVQLVKTYPKVGDLVEHCSHPDYEVYSAIESLIGRGMVEEEKGAEGAVEREEFITPEQAISIREKILSRYTDMHNLNYGKIFIFSTSGAVVNGFMEKCRSIPGFTLSSRGASQKAPVRDPLGEMAAIKIYGGMDLLLYSIPCVRNMGPILRAFSANLVGLMLMWDERGVRDLKELAAAKKEILQRRRIPAVHIFSGRATGEDIAAYKKAFNLRLDEPLLKLGAEDDFMVFEAFYTLFGGLLKDDYITA